VAALFWFCVAYVLYVYAGFPLLVLLRARVARKPYRLGEQTPSATVLIAARNEEAVIRSRIENLLSLDYPPEALDVVVASDGSDDATNDIVHAYEGARVRLLALPRVGKPEALNAAVGAATGEILVFSDANSIFRPDAIRRLVEPFADPAVGGVAGNQVYLPAEGGDSSVVGEHQYWDFDRVLKRAESDAGSVSGATGAIYAIRRPLFTTLRADVNNDDLLNSLGVVAQGHRLVFAPEAVAFEHAADATKATFDRRVRVMVGGFRCLLVMRGLLNPLRYGFFAVQLLTRKVLLRTMVIPLAVLSLLAPLLWSSGLLYRLLTVGEGLFYALALGGFALRNRPVSQHRLLALPAYFCLVNLASAKALAQVALGIDQARWEPARSGPKPASSSRPRRGDLGS
jgi:cellulose synthase/poly-beta-1,6-N-acetylglucosamine synthase-like glycosyltransferase